MTHDRPTDASPTTGDDRWAPWWVYLIVLIPANWVRSALLPGDTFSTPVTVAIALVQAAVLFLVVTLVYRALRGRRFP